MGRYVVAPVDEIPPGSRRIVTVQGREIGIFNVGGRFFALRNSCAHQGGPLCEGALVGHLRSERPGHYEFDSSRKFVECPWHGWEFDLQTGLSWFDPRKTRVGRYEVERRLGADLELDPVTGLARGPYTVESYRVELERDYVVLEVKE
jgi:nitrite reductase/ring-hydroxylating ferredoxin subunit